MARTWRYAVHDEPRVKTLARELQVPGLVAQVLLARGVTDIEAAREFLQSRLMDMHDPALIPGIDDAADRIVPQSEQRLFLPTESASRQKGGEETGCRTVAVANG